MSVGDIVDGLAIIQQKRGRIVDQGDVEMLALAIKELRKGRRGGTPPAEVEPRIAEALREVCYVPGHFKKIEHLNYCRWCHYVDGHAHAPDCVMALLSPLATPDTITSSPLDERGQPQQSEESK